MVTGRSEHFRGPDSALGCNYFNTKSDSNIEKFKNIILILRNLDFFFNFFQIVTPISYGFSRRTRDDLCILLHYGRV